MTIFENYCCILLIIQIRKCLKKAYQKLNYNHQFPQYIFRESLLVRKNYALLVLQYFFTYRLKFSICYDEIIKTTVCQVVTNLSFASDSGGRL